MSAALAHLRAGYVSDALRQHDTRAAWYAIRWHLRWQRRHVASDLKSARLPGHNAMAMGRALESLTLHEDASAMRAIVRLSHAAMRTLKPFQG